MKRYILKIFFFFVCAIFLDILYGQAFSYLRSHAKGGITLKNEYIANICEDDIIIFGSSRAAHHYNPYIIEESTGLSCYNCGEKGNGIILAYSRFKMILERHKPKLVLFEVTPDFDYGVGDDNRKYLSYLRPYYDSKAIKDVFKDFDDEMYCLKMQSKAYQNTSKLLHNVVDNVVSSDNTKGFLPLYGSITDDYLITNSTANPSILIDSLKLSYVKKLIEESKSLGIPIVFISSPLYQCDKYENLGPVYDYKPAKELCEKNNVPFWDFFSEPSIIYKPQLWHDGGHMNIEGASVYSRIIAKRLETLGIN